MTGPAQRGLRLVEGQAERSAGASPRLSDRVLAAAAGPAGSDRDRTLESSRRRAGARGERGGDPRPERGLAEAQEQLDAEVTRYRELFDLAPDGYLVTDTNGVILEVQPGGQRAARVPRRDFLYRKPVIVFVDASDRRAVLYRLHDASAARRRVVTFDAGFAPPNGRTFPASVHLTVGGAAEAGNPRVLWLVRDISRRTEAERALSASETRYRLIAESAADVVIATDSAVMSSG